MSMGLQGGRASGAVLRSRERNSWIDQATSALPAEETLIGCSADQDPECHLPRVLSEPLFGSLHLTSEGTEGVR